MDGNKSITAVFAKLSYELTITVSPAGAGTVTEELVTRKTAYQYGDEIRLTAAANAGYVFDHWEGDLSGNDNPATLTVDKAKTVTAVFTAIPASWQAVGSAGFSAGRADYVSLAIDGSGMPYVAYRDGGNGYKATVRTYSGGAWTTVGSAGFSAGQADHTSLAIDGSGVPYVAYLDGGNGNKATVMKYSGGLDPVGSAGFSAGQADHTSLAHRRERRALCGLSGLGQWP
jgi:hypothetical protein